MRVIPPVTTSIMSISRIFAQKIIWLHATCFDMQMIKTIR